MLLDEVGDVATPHVVAEREAALLVDGDGRVVAGHDAGGVGAEGERHAGAEVGEHVFVAVGEAATPNELGVEDLGLDR